MSIPSAPSSAPPSPRLAIACLGLAFLAGCVAPGTDFEALPFYREDRTEPGRVSIDIPPLLLSMDSEWVEPAGPGAEPEERTVLNFPWPVAQLLTHGEHHTFSITNPLAFPLGRDSGPAGRALSSDADVRQDLVPSLAPDAAGGGLTALPFYFYDTLVDHADIPDVEGHEYDRDTGLLPFFMWGSGTGDDEDYLVVAPFGGKTKGILGKDEITWWGFPYPIYLDIRDPQYDSTHILWPAINWVDGPQNTGFRVLPWYAHYERKGVRGEPIYERTWILWPFFTYQRNGLNEVAPTETLFLFPFYGRIDGPDHDEWTVLWPFFGYEEDQLADTWELRAPFPFLQVAGGEDRWKFDLWPLFGVKERPGFHRHFALWPIWRYEDLAAEDKRFDGQWLLPLYWRTHWESLEEGTSETRIRLFPLLHYRSLRDGSVELAALSPWWVDDPRGFESVIGPFLRLYRYHRDPRGGVEHQALLGLFSYRDLPAIEGRAAYTRLSLLFGLFQYRRLGDESGLRLLYLPEITWGG